MARPHPLTDRNHQQVPRTTGKKGKDGDSKFRIHGARMEMGAKYIQICNKKRSSTKAVVELLGLLLQCRMHNAEDDGEDWRRAATALR